MFWLFLVCCFSKVGWVVKFFAYDIWICLGKGVTYLSALGVLFHPLGLQVDLLALGLFWEAYGRESEARRGSALPTPPKFLGFFFWVFVVLAGVFLLSFLFLHIGPCGGLVILEELGPKPSPEWLEAEVVGSRGIILSKHSRKEALPQPPWNSPAPTDSVTGFSGTSGDSWLCAAVSSPSWKSELFLPQASPILGVPLEQFPSPCHSHEVRCLKWI